MAKIQRIKKQLVLIKQVQHVTRAMKTISAVRLRLGKEAVERSRDFVKTLEKNLDLIDCHRAFAILPEERILLLGIFSDRGLVGEFNKNVARFLLRFGEQKGLSRVRIAVLGRQGWEELKNVKEYMVFFSPLAVHHVPHYADLRNLASQLLKVKETERCTHLYLVFTRYFSIAHRVPQVIQVLPPQPRARYVPREMREKWQWEYRLLGDVVSLQRLLEQQYFLGKLYHAVMESFVSEQAARFTIMDTAAAHSKNTIESLTIWYHKKRQEKITQELNEVTGAAEVLRLS